MSDYIKREDAKLRIFEYGVRHRDNGSIASACENLERQMNALPAADVVERKRGKWFRGYNPNYSPFDDSGEYRYCCSECKHVQNRVSNFCPNCGADLREPPKEDT